MARYRSLRPYPHTHPTMSFVQSCQAVLEGIYKLKDEDGRPQWEVFHDVPSPQLTHYYTVMKRPMSLIMIRQNLRKGSYHSAQEFVRDVAQIAQNAKAYNAPSTIYWQDADALERYIRQQLVTLQNAAGSSDVELRYPNLEPVLKSESEIDDDSSDAGTPGLLRSRRRRTRTKSMADSLDLGTPPPSTAASLKREREEEEEMEGRRKRGRPPTVDKPHEHRIKAILRAVRRVKDASGRMLCREFEKVPDQRLVPEYHTMIERPLALDSVRKNIKRRQYPTVDAFLADMNLIFSNAKRFVGSEAHPVYQDAETLQHIMDQTADEEKKKPDSAYADPDSNSKVARLPMDTVEHRGETYMVGDWVHISNPNDPGKPTVGQVFRLWREQGKLWANCCWYYRPEQTVHKWDKLFWENEVVKSGQYRDHLVDDILEKCFVMFITKYQRGRPKDIGTRSVYLCESRYNEGEKTFNKIRTWKACIPDEIRNSDYQMDMFDKPRPLKKLYSPLRNDLPADARDDDPVPEPIMGDPMAPPLKGAVYKRPYDPSDPPEEPTPPSPPHKDAIMRDSEMSAAVTPLDSMPNPAAPTPAMPGMMPSGMMAPGMGPGMGPGMAPGMAPGMMPPGMAPGMGPGMAGPVMPSAYILPDMYTNTLDEASLAGVAKLPQGQPLWFINCPVSVTHRVLADPLPPSLRFDVDGETKQGSTHAHGFGHSAKYLAWKRARVA